MIDARTGRRLAEWRLPSWYLSAYNVLVIVVFGLIALGGSVRIMKAGLACPDWPLCFGDLIPDYHPQVYFEFIHRVVAGSVAIVTLGLHMILFRSRAPGRVKAIGALALGLLLAQIIFGGLTVLLLLQSYVVATHLILGTSFFSSLLWLYLSLRAPAEPEPLGPAWLRGLSVYMVCLVFFQILLGGLVASNFASLACTEWPACQGGVWFPTFSGMIGLHLIHRLGAYTVFVSALINWILMLRFATSARARRLSGILFLCVCGQLLLGIANVLLYTPPIIAVGHLALGVGILSVAWRQLHLALGSPIRLASPVGFDSQPIVSYP